MVERIGGRKVLVAIITITLALGIVLVHGDLPDNFTNLLEVVFGAFVTGNMFEHYKEIRLGASTDSVDIVDNNAGPSIEDIKSHFSDTQAATNEQIAQTQAAVGKTLEGIGTLQQAVQHIIVRTGLNK